MIGLLGLGHVSGKLIHFDFLSNESYRLYARFDSVAGLEIGYPVYIAI
jgi:ABC-type transporter Mla subunit MlaD